MTPSPWVALVLALGAFRLVRLIGWDDFPPIERLRARLTGERVYPNATTDGQTRFLYSRPVLAKFLHCAFCQGAWVSFAVYVAWLEAPRPSLYAAAPLALSSAVGLIAKQLDP